MRRVLGILCALLSGLLPAAAQNTLAERLAALERAVGVKPLETTCFDEKYELILRQPLDWQAPDANLIFVEHRYFLASTPEPRDWTYLTAEASADDLHDVRTLLGTIYPGKWIATGISKGGTTTMLYATFYPEDVDVYVPYVGPVNRAREDGRHEKFLRRVGTAEQRAVIEQFQLEVLRRRERLMPLFEAYCRDKKYEFRAPLSEIYDFCVLEYPFSFWQWGSDAGEIPAASATDRDLFDYFIVRLRLQDTRFAYIFRIVSEGRSY